MLFFASWLFWCQLLSLRDIGHRAFCLLSNIIELDCPRLVVLTSARRLNLKKSTAVHLSRNQDLVMIISSVVVSFLEEHISSLLNYTPLLYHFTDGISWWGQHLVLSQAQASHPWVDAFTPTVVMSRWMNITTGKWNNMYNWPRSDCLFNILCTKAQTDEELSPVAGFTLCLRLEFFLKSTSPLFFLYYFIFFRMATLVTSCARLSNNCFILSYFMNWWLLHTPQINTLWG